MSIHEIVQNIDARIAELERQIAPLENARKALTETRPSTAAEATPAPAAATATTTAERPRRARRAQTAKAKAKAVKRKPQVVPAGTLIALLPSDGAEGVTTAALAKRSDADLVQVRTLLKELEATGEVRRSGERRGTRWHLFTDEQKVAARAAEIEAQISGASQS